MSSRTVQVPVWVLVSTALVTGAVAAAIIIGGRTDGQSTAQQIVGESIPGSTTVTVSSSPISTTVAVATSAIVPSTTTRATTLPPPRGTLHVTSYGYHVESTGRCANWRDRFVNNSNTEIVRIVISSPSGRYRNLAASDYNTQTKQYPPDIPAAKPEPAVLMVSLPPYDEQILAYQTCTSTASPSNENYEFSADAPSTVSFTWVTGQTGSAPRQ